MIYTVTDRPVRPRVSTLLYLVPKLSLLLCHTPVTLIKTTYLLTYLLRPFSCTLNHHSLHSQHCELVHYHPKHCRRHLRGLLSSCKCLHCLLLPSRVNAISAHPVISHHLQSSNCNTTQNAICKPTTRRLSTFCCKVITHTHLSKTNLQASIGPHIVVRSGQVSLVALVRSL